MFKRWLNIDEMAIAQFGKHGPKDGKPPKHINDIDTGYLNWLLQQIEQEKRGFIDPKTGLPIKTSFNFMADDGSGRLTKQQVEDAIKIRINGSKIASTSANSPIVAFSEKPTKEPISPQEEPKQPVLNNVDKSKYLISPEKISEYQKGIEEAFSRTNKHMVINALAGTGKSTVLKHLAAKFQHGKKWLYLVFNNRNAAEATSGEKAFPPGVETFTSHSFLGRVLKDTNRYKPEVMKDTSLPLKGDKGSKLGKVLDNNWFKGIAKQIQSQRGFPGRASEFVYYSKVKNSEQVNYNLKTKITKLVSLSKAWAINPDKQDARDIIAWIMSKYSMDGYLVKPSNDEDDEMPTDFTDQIIQLSLEVLKKSKPSESIGDTSLDSMRDHDDTVWWASLNPDKMVWPTNRTYEVALVDEVQDFNEAQKIMLEHLDKNGIRIIMVGDKNQSLYRFRGADANSFSNIETMLKGTSLGATSHELPVNYRSGKKIIDYVNKSTHVKDLKSGRDHDGEVNNTTYEKVMGDIEQEWEENKELKHETAFIARGNKPLAAAAMELLKNNIPFIIIGKDFSNEITDFIYKVVGNDKVGFGKSNARSYKAKEFGQIMTNYIEQKNHKYEGEKDKEKYLEELSQTYEALISLLSHIQDNEWKDQYSKEINNVEDLCEYVRNIFKGIEPQDTEKDAEKYANRKKKGAVILTTAHKSKGLEFERVNILENDKFPAGDTYDPADEEAEQEHNAKYVAYTRGTHVLNVAD